MTHLPSKSLGEGHRGRGRGPGPVWLGLYALVRGTEKSTLVTPENGSTGTIHTDTTFQS
mgnify:CR=1 FL=1